MDQSRDLVLPPGIFAYVLDATKGDVAVYVGPTKTPLSEQDQLVRWDPATGRFPPTDNIEQAKTPFVTAGEGEYVILTNPASNSSHPPVGRQAGAVPDLDTGRRIVIPGPTTFALWPGQTAEAVEGHDLRHNQYLVLRVYEPKAANEQGGGAIEITAGGQAGSDEPPAPTEEATPIEAAEATDGRYKMGQLEIKQGTTTSFYIPSTGIEVVPDDNNRMVRDAVTLERMEYCILLDEDGNKRFMYGPDVVFPSPTETFVENADGDRKSKAIELNKQSGLYVKVIAPYNNDGTDVDEDHPDNADHRVGEELFIIGGDEGTSIYWPRPEHMIITQGDQRKHHAIAIPPGEGRYVLQRETGFVETVKGHEMYLPDPRTHVIIRRILPESLVSVMYPGNTEALEVNRRYSAEQAQVEQVLANTAMASQQSMMYTSPTPGLEKMGSGSAFATMDSASTTPEELMRSSRSRPRGAGAEPVHAETTRRGTTYTPPRTIVLDTKYSGAVTMQLLPGYAQLITSKTGGRRVVIGPGPVMLDYDEIPMTLSLSRGRPKTDRNLYQTVYLRIANNSISDILTVETSDLVSANVELVLRVNFITNEFIEPEQWFAVENYVQVLVDNCRSRVRNEVKRMTIQEFYGNPIDTIRDTLLGIAPPDGQRPGRLFEENGMLLYDVEVPNGVTILHAGIESLLSNAMTSTLEGNIKLSEAKARTEREGEHEALTRQGIDQKEATRQREVTAALARLESELGTKLKDVANRIAVRTEESKIAELGRDESEAAWGLQRTQTEEQNRLDLDRAKEEVDHFIARVGALDERLIDALRLSGDQTVLAGYLHDIGPAAAAMGVTNADLFKVFFEGTPFEPAIKALAGRPFATAVGTGGNGDE